MTQRSATDFSVDKSTGDKHRVSSVERSILIMDYVADAPGPVGVSDIARHLGLAKSTVHGLCETLANSDMLRRGAMGYQLGAYPLRWGSAFLERTSLVQEFHGLIAQDATLSEYTVTLSVLEHTDVVYLACHNSPKPLGFTFQTGQHLPAVFTATGKAMLSRLTAEARRDRLAQTGWPVPFTAKSVVDLNALEGQIPRWQALGYAMDEGEIRDGMVCLGAALPLSQGRPMAAIAISLTQSEAQDDLCRRLGQKMADFARRLGYL